MSDLPEVTVRIETDHLCHWSDSVESTADELLDARTQLSVLEAENARLKERERGYREAFKEILKFSCGDDSFNCQECGGTVIARKALEQGEIKK